MGYAQTIHPTPDISCRPGWCLEYVRRTYRLPAAYPTATAAWLASTSQHRDRAFPKAVWIPVWYGLVNEPAGHVVLLAPDGSCYSTSSLGTTPYHHPNLKHLENFYAHYGMTLTYRGWTEDVAGTPVITPATITAQALAPEQDDIMAVNLSADNLKAIADAVHTRPAPIPAGGHNTLEWSLGAERARQNETITAALSAGGVSAADIAAAISPQLAADLLTELTRK